MAMIFNHAAWRSAAAGMLAIGLACIGLGPAAAAGIKPLLPNIGEDGILPMIGMPYVGSELRMGSPDAFVECAKTEAAPNGYTVQWLSNGTPLPAERQKEALKVLPEDRGNRLSFNVYPTAYTKFPESPPYQNVGCPNIYNPNPEKLLLHSLETAPIAASNRANGWTGRGNLELLGRTDDGELVLYPRTSTYEHVPCPPNPYCPAYTSDWEQPRLVGIGWNIFNIVFSPGDFDGDGNNDILGRDSAGNLYLYPGDGLGNWQQRSVVGTGWNIFDAIIGPGDFDGDGNNDVLGRGHYGDLLLYPGDGHGGWKQPRRVGIGWQVFDKIIAAGDITGDGAVDIFGRDHGGDLHQYPSDGHGGWLPPSRWGPGWEDMSEISAAGSYDRNLVGTLMGTIPQTSNDLYAINPDGALLRYAYTLRIGHTIGTGWGIFTALI
ncbi:FG-GAP repeat domain-containing protein [Paenarthrobacter aromaticivorans]|nr:VCBS repeat-containing protein [Paenarthrobacter sp. MMS21-TAE1-1]